MMRSCALKLPNATGKGTTMIPSKLSISIKIRRLSLRTIVKLKPQLMAKTTARNYLSLFRSKQGSKDLFSRDKYSDP